jgi:hypothetical protein
MLSYLQLIIAKGLALVDGIMENWTTAPAAIDSACGIGQINVALNTCGTDFANSIAKLAVGGVALLQGVIQALSAGSY